MIEQLFEPLRSAASVVSVLALLGGLAIFLYGLNQLSDALKALAGERLRTLIRKLTRNPFTGVLTGATATGIIQSSSITTVLVIGFVSSGILSMSQAVGVIMGANIGTTITAQLIAFQIADLALVLIVAGFAIDFFLGRSDRMHWFGLGTLGLGLIFLGMNMMGEAMAPLAEDPEVMAGLSQMENPIWGILAGAIVTALIQSSSATTGMVIVMASQGLITLEAGIALILGANIGTCVTALLGAIGKRRDAVRAAMVHVVFNVVGVLIWLPMLGLLADWTVAISPSASGNDLLGNGAREIANAHTIFNVANTVLFLPFASGLGKLVQRLVPDRPERVSDAAEPKFLDPELLITPALALDRVRLELSRLSGRVIEMFEVSLSEILTGSHISLNVLRNKDEAVDAVHGELIQYMGKISQEPLTDAQTQSLIALMEVTNSLESIGDLIENNLVRLGHERINLDVQVSPETRRILEEMHGLILTALDAAVAAVTGEDPEAANRAIELKDEVSQLAKSASAHQAKRLVADEPNRLPAYTVEMDILENLRRVYYFCRRMARAALQDRDVEIAD